MKYYIPYIYSTRDMSNVGHGYAVIISADPLETEEQINEVTESIKKQIKPSGDYVITVLDWKRIF